MIRFAFIRATKIEVAQYRDEVAAVVDTLYARAVELLEGDWLKLEGLDSTVDAAGESQLLSTVRLACVLTGLANM